MTLWLPEGADPTRIEISTDPAVQRMSGRAYHGDTPFDVPYVSHIEGNLWTGGCTEGLIVPQEIQHVVSLYPWEQYEVKHQLRSYSLHWLYDSAETPDVARVDAIAAWVAACLDDGPTLVHCQAGLNRSGLIAARALVLRGMAAPDAVALLRDRRSPAVLCNPAFAEFLLGVAA